MVPIRLCWSHRVMRTGWTMKVSRRTRRWCLPSTRRLESGRGRKEWACLVLEEGEGGKRGGGGSRALRAAAVWWDWAAPFQGTWSGWALRRTPVRRRWWWKLDDMEVQSNGHPNDSTDGSYIDNWAHLKIILWSVITHIASLSWLIEYNHNNQPIIETEHLIIYIYCDVNFSSVIFMPVQKAPTNLEYSLLQAERDRVWFCISCKQFVKADDDGCGWPPNSDHTLPRFHFLLPNPQVEVQQC